jgi:hypothetical protein
VEGGAGRAVVVMGEAGKDNLPPQENAKMVGGLEGGERNVAAGDAMQLLGCRVHLATGLGALAVGLARFP